MCGPVLINLQRGSQDRIANSFAVHKGLVKRSVEKSDRKLHLSASFDLHRYSQTVVRGGKFCVKFEGVSNFPRVFSGAEALWTCRAAVAGIHPAH